MKIGFVKRAMFVVGLLGLFSIRVVAQDQIECGINSLDGGFCGCDYGYYPDGSCLPEGGGGGSGSSCDMSASYFTYTDENLNDDGTLSAWTITTNLDGVAGEGTIFSSIGGTLTDGTVVPVISAITSTAPSIEAYFTSPIVTSSDNGSGQLSTGSYISWNCGTSTILFSVIPLSIKNTYESWTGYSTTIQGGGATLKVCFYDSACTNGTPTCGSVFHYIQGLSVPCDQYMMINSLYVSVFGKCFPLSTAATATGPGVCD